MHDTCVQPLEKCHSLPKALSEVDLSAHGTGGDLLYLIPDACPIGKLVDHLGLDERRVHIEADQAPHPAEHAVLLEGDVHMVLVRYADDMSLHRHLILGCPAE